LDGCESCAADGKRGSRGKLRGETVIKMRNFFVLCITRRLESPARQKGYELTVTNSNLCIAGSQV